MKSKISYISIAVGIGVIALAVFYMYSTDQAKIRGQYFGDSLKSIQDELKKTQTEFYSKKSMLDEGTISKEEFVEFGNSHVEKMKEILKTYDLLSPPDSFAKSVELFRISTQKQIESDKYLIEWIATDDPAHKVRSDILLQESFENEIAGLASYNQAKNNAGQN